MNSSTRIYLLALSILCILTLHPAFAANTDVLANVKSQADLDAVVTSTSDPALKQAIRDNAAAILAAAEQRPHVLAVMHTIDSAPGKYEEINTTPDGLKKAAGGEVALFETLKLVDLQVPGMGPHDHRKVDPYDAAFFEHLSHITPLESLNIISTKADDQWVAPLGKLKNLKSLRFVNNGKLTDAGLENFAGMTGMEQFSYVGTQMKGHAFAKFVGWNKLTRCSFRGSSIDDEGLRELCEHFPNLESISLAHAKFTDAGAVYLAKLTKLKGLEIGTHAATLATLRNLASLPLDYLQLGEGFDSPDALPMIKDFKSLHRLTLTNAKGLKDADLKILAGMTQLQSLELSNTDLTDDRLGELQQFSFLKALRLVRRPQGFSEEARAKIKAMLPKTALTFE